MCISGGGETCWSKKQRRCRYELKKWSRGKYPNARVKAEKLTNELELLQQDWEENERRIEQVNFELNETWRQEESFWKQRSRIQWLKAGDSNTAFFHHCTLQRRRRNKISRIKGVNGDWGENVNQVRMVFEDYFKGIFSAGGTRDWGNVLACISPVITDQMNADLCKLLSDEEIKEAAFQLGANKAPGPDGFSGIFYHNYWETVGGDLCKLIKDFFKGDLSVHSLNMTEIALIPKVPNPEVVTQFRPIALCNFSYKSISKILANRLKPILAEIISPQQSAFIPGRQIQDNILIAHEAFHALKIRKKTKVYQMGLKLDMNKAYDRIEWDFVKEVLHKLGFDSTWVRLVMRCITSVRFTVLLNGKAGIPFKPTRGIRQGDPISPYIFILVSDVLSSMLNKAVERGIVQGIKFREDGPTLSHLFFADDSLLFLKVTEENCAAIERILKSYCQASGQVVNFEKSSIYFSPNTPQQLREKVGNILHVCTTDNPGKYLGLPTMWGRSKREALNFVKERILRKWRAGSRNFLLRLVGKSLLKQWPKLFPRIPCLFSSSHVAFAKSWMGCLLNSGGGEKKERIKSIGLAGRSWE
ncbi:hypothetical protein CerSpe_214410 [Prunus speciosa]